MNEKFAVHPGNVQSKTDGQMHYISGPALARLYELKPGEYIIWDCNRPETFMGLKRQDYRHLYPSFSGKYGRPPESAANE